MVSEPSIMVKSKSSIALDKTMPKVSPFGSEFTIHIKNAHFVTLGEENFVSWNAQISAILFGNDLLN